ncbi:hypothetical protein B0O99DRAFT_634378 [Bisporella sp. PMI_857]|nr:hypothetical protein B0O99DRAFT_634378 [Bisporella sp. PMI_857]
MDIYSGCSLAICSDKLIAIAGLAAAFSKSIQAQYYAGLWGNHRFLMQLLWTSNDLNGQCSRFTGYTPPPALRHLFGDPFMLHIISRP